MPYRKAAKKAPYRRGKGRYKRAPKRKARYNKAVIDRMPGKGLADMLYVKLSYVDRIDIATMVNAYTPYVFRGNSLFDPDVTGTGHQPLYFDQYSALYSKYRVLGSSLQLDVVNNSGVSALFYAAEANTDVSTITAISTLYEQSRAAAPKLVPIAARITSRMKRYMSTRKVCGLTKTQVYDDTFAAGVTGSPSNVWYWNILFESVDGTTVINGHFMVKIDYYVQFFDRTLIGQS